jgi:predicted permease
LADFVDYICINDLDINQKVSSWQAELSIHPFRLEESDPDFEYLEGESTDLPAAEQLELPNLHLKGLWESIIIDSHIKQLLIDYACTSLLFSQANIDPTLVSRSAAYISLYLLGWSPLFWIIGPAILQSNSNATDSQKDPNKARKELLQRIFSPPVIGSIGGMIVGFIPFLRNLILFGNSPLNVVYEAMKTLGAAYLPAVLLVLSGSLFPPATSSSTTTTATPSSNTMDIKFLMKVTVIYLSRFLLMPLIGFSLVRLGSTVSPALQTLLSRDRLLLFVLLLETCMPSAQNTTVILQLQGNKSAATKLARTLMIIYVLGVPAISYWLIEILKLTKLAS